MTTDRPDGAQLLAMAREALLRDLLPELPQSRRFLALMIANAMAMARRELETPAASGEPETLRGLAVALRAGERDGDQGTYRVLLDACLARVRVSQPRALKQYEGSET